MAEQNSVKTLGRARRQVDLITAARNLSQASIARHIAVGFILALFFERLIDEAHYAALSADINQLYARWQSEDAKLHLQSD